MRKMNFSHSARRFHQQGQALTEFLVVAVALVPLFLLVPIIAKYQDIAHATQLASRYAAFDGMTRNDSQNTAKPTAQLQDEVRRRFFSTSDAPIKTGDVAGDFKAHQNLFWCDPVDKPLIASFADVTVTRSNQRASDVAPAFVFSFAGQRSAQGIASANVLVKLANLPSGLSFYEPFDKIDLTMVRGTSVLVDGWSGKHPEDVIAKVEPLVPANKILGPLSALIDPTLRLVEPGVSPPNLGSLTFWRDDVPKDRIP